MGVSERQEEKTNIEIKSKSTINDFESTYPELAKEFQIIQQEQYNLFAGKMMDYGISNISLGSTLTEKEDIPPKKHVKARGSQLC